MLNQHIFARHSATSSEPTKPATLLIEALGLLGQRTGFGDQLTPGAICQEALLQVDRKSVAVIQRRPITNVYRP